jgi:hypothetical protein
VLQGTAVLGEVMRKGIAMEVSTGPCGPRLPGNPSSRAISRGCCLEDNKLSMNGGGASLPRRTLRLGSDQYSDYR